MIKLNLKKYKPLYSEESVSPITNIYDHIVYSGMGGKDGHQYMTEKNMQNKSGENTLIAENQVSVISSTCIIRTISKNIPCRLKKIIGSVSFGY